jgi:nucleoside-diphosphate-sugar epimerase
LSKRRILLLGGAGTLGSDILDADFREYELFVVDDFSESALTEEELKHKCNFRKMSVANELEMINVFQGFKPDVVIYLATTLSSDQKRAYESNVLGMFNTIICAQKTKLPKIVYIQSFLTRNSAIEIDVNSPVEAKDSYSTWKLAAEFLLNSYTGKKVTLVLASVLSPRLSIGAVPAFVKRIQGNEKIMVTNTSRDYINPETFISALKAILNNIEDEDEVIVLGSSQPVSTLDILKHTSSACGITLEDVDYEIVVPKSSDPASISLSSDWLNQIQGNSTSIESSIKSIVTNLIHDRKEIRLHH